MPRRTQTYAIRLAVERAKLDTERPERAAYLPLELLADADRARGTRQTAITPCQHPPQRVWFAIGTAVTRRPRTDPGVRCPSLPLHFGDAVGYFSSSALECFAEPFGRFVQFGGTTVVMFLLVPQVKLSKRREVARAAERWFGQLLVLIEQQLSRG